MGEEIKIFDGAGGTWKACSGSRCTRGPLPPELLKRGQARVMFVEPAQELAPRLGRLLPANRESNRG